MKKIWTVNSERARSAQVVNSAGRKIARVWLREDAALIAAAPELYELLHDLVEGLGPEAPEPIQRVLAKARGEEYEPEA